MVYILGPSLDLWPVMRPETLELGTLVINGTQSMGKLCCADLEPFEHNLAAPSISPESCPTRLWERARLANGHLAIRIVASLSAYVMHGTLVLTAVKPPSAGRQTVVPSTYIASIMYNDPVRIGAGSFFGAPQ